MRIAFGYLSILAAGLPSAVSAAPVVIQVIGPGGSPLADAVVQVTVAGRSAAVPSGPYVMNQRDISFQPHILVVPVGATVRFANSDTVRHHVYSFSRAKKFELKLFGRQEDRTVTFEKAGAVALGCNIHDRMSGVIYVAATPYVAVTDGDGKAMMDVAPGRGMLTVWHPAIRAADNQMSQPAAIAPAGLATIIRLPR